MWEVDGSTALKGTLLIFSDLVSDFERRSWHAKFHRRT
jgi:hypothetical protein